MAGYPRFVPNKKQTTAGAQAREALAARRSQGGKLPAPAKHAGDAARQTIANRRQNPAAFEPKVPEGNNAIGRAHQKTDERRANSQSRGQ